MDYQANMVRTAAQFGVDFNVDSKAMKPKSPTWRESSQVASCNRQDVCIKFLRAIKIPITSKVMVT